MLGRAASDAAAMPRFRSLLVARHGKLVAENYFGGASSSTVFDLRSVTKSVVSMLTGIAIQNGSRRTSMPPSVDTSTRPTPRCGRSRRVGTPAADDDVALSME